MLRTGYPAMCPATSWNCCKAWTTIGPCIRYASGFAMRRYAAGLDTHRCYGLRPELREDTSHPQHFNLQRSAQRRNGAQSRRQCRGAASCVRSGRSACSDAADLAPIQRSGGLYGCCGAACGRAGVRGRESFRQDKNAHVQRPRPLLGSPCPPSRTRSRQPRRDT